MKRVFGLLAVLFAVVAMSYGQTTSGNLVGTVKDTTGAVIPNATVVAVNEDTGVTYTGTTTSSGDVNIPNLPAGNYDVSATAGGFTKFTLKAVRVDINKSSTVNMVMTVSTTQTVEVSAVAAVALDTTTTNLTQTFEPVELQNLPMTSASGNGVLNVSLLSPGVASAGGIGIGTGPSVGGQRPRNNNFMIEGIDNNNKGVTGPLVYVPVEAVGEFSLITNQFAPEFGHSSGGQFNTNIISGTNTFHGQIYENFQNRNLNAENVPANQPQPNPRYDYNRYGGQLGGPIMRDRLFFFANFERHTLGQGLQHFLCTPTAAGLNQIKGISGLNATNVAQFLKYMPASPSQVTDANDNSCFNQASGPQTIAIFDGTTLDKNNVPSENVGAPVYGSGTEHDIPVGNYLVSAPSYSNFDALTTSGDWTISARDSLRARYIYNTNPTLDNVSALPVFYTTQPNKFHLFTLSEYHTFTPNLTNEVRIGFNRFAQLYDAGNFKFPGLDAFPNLYFYDLGFIDVGPDDNAPQSTIQNLYQFVDNISWTRGKHQLKFGFDGRKYIAPQTFTQRARGDYEWDYLTEYLHDLAPTGFAERSTGNFIYYGDQTALYGYFNDTWHALPNVTINYGVRYEFTSVPVGERAQSLNAAASVPGLINFHAPQPQYKNFDPRVGVDWAPDDKTSIRAGFGMAQDVLFDNLGLLSFPPQYSSTNDVGVPPSPDFGDPNFLSNGGLPGGGAKLATFPTIAAQRKATSAYLPDQVVPYAETWTVGVQRVFAKNYTAEVRYVGTRGIHLPTQDQINIQPRVTKANQLFTSFDGAGISKATYKDPNTGDTTTYNVINTPANANTYAQIAALSNIVPAFKAAGFTSKITSYQPFSGSNYNGLQTSLTRRFQNGLGINAAYTWSKTMDDATAEVFATVLTPRRPQNSQDVAADYSRSALDRTHRFSIAVVYDLPYFKHSNWFAKNLIGNWTITPTYIYESPEYAVALSGVNSNLNGDSTAIDRSMINSTGKKGTGTGVTAVYSNDATLSGKCSNGAFCNANLVGYVANDKNAYYVQAGKGTLPTGTRNTLPIRPINDVDMSLKKRLNFGERFAFQFGIDAFNVLNHPQYIPGAINNIDTKSFTSSLQFQQVSTPAFNHPEFLFNNNGRSLQLGANLSF